jgi:hypothetical protein
VLRERLDLQWTPKVMTLTFNLQLPTAVRP